MTAATDMQVGQPRTSICKCERFTTRRFRPWNALGTEAAPGTLPAHDRDHGAPGAPPDLGHRAVRPAGWSLCSGAAFEHKSWRSEGATWPMRGRGQGGGSVPAAWARGATDGCARTEFFLLGLITGANLGANLARKPAQIGGIPPFPGAFGWFAAARRCEPKFDYRAEIKRGRR